MVVCPKIITTAAFKSILAKKCIHCWGRTWFCVSSQSVNTPHGRGGQKLFPNSQWEFLVILHTFSLIFPIDIYLISAFSELVHVVRVSRHFCHQFVSNTGSETKYLEERKKKDITSRELFSKKSKFPRGNLTSFNVSLQVVVKYMCFYSRLLIIIIIPSRAFPRAHRDANEDWARAEQHSVSQVAWKEVGSVTSRSLMNERND